MFLTLTWDIKLFFGNGNVVNGSVGLTGVALLNKFWHYCNRAS
jgi:hypothetical protein